MKKLFLLAIILFYSNAQSNWTFVSTVPTSPNISSISVVDQNLIWVAATAGKVYRTTDAGTTWVLRNTGLPASDLYGISALDSSSCWVGTVAGSIYRTTNGGFNWTLQFSVSGSFSNGIKMFDANYGIYYGDPTAAGQPYQLRYTTNGGTNWTLSPGAPIAGNEFGVINAWDWTDTARIWIGSANITANATTANIYKTTIGYRGGGWSTVSLTGVGGTAGLYYQAVAFTNASNGMAGSNGSNFRKTTDGGVTWQTVTNPSGLVSFAAINMVGLKDGSNTIRVSVNTTTGNFAYKTTDLGTTWISEPLPAQGTTNGLQHMQFVNSTLGYAGGNAGTFFKYSNISVNIKMAIEGLYNASTNSHNLRDTVRVYLRNNTSPYAVVDSSKTVIDSLTLIGKCVFENAPSGTYYMQFKYRSGVETWSKTGGETYSTGNSYSYNLALSAAQAYGSNMVQVDASPVTFAIYSGDVNQDGFVDGSDGSLVDNDAFNFIGGYVSTDVNGDFIVDGSDAAIVDNNGFNFVGKVTP